METTKRRPKVSKAPITFYNDRIKQLVTILESSLEMCDILNCIIASLNI